MPNNNYKRGYNLERRVKLWFEEQGMLAVRASGSHGIYDIWATNGHLLTFVQCKIGASIPYAQRLVKEMYDRYALHYRGASIPATFQVIDGFEDGKPRVLAYDHYVFKNKKEKA